MFPLLIRSALMVSCGVSALMVPPLLICPLSASYRLPFPGYLIYVRKFESGRNPICGKSKSRTKGFVILGIVGDSSMIAYGTGWDLMGPYGTLWKLMGAYGSLWELMGLPRVLGSRQGPNQICGKSKAEGRVSSVVRKSGFPSEGAFSISGTSGGTSEGTSALMVSCGVSALMVSPLLIRFLSALFLWCLVVSRSYGVL